MRNRLDFLVIGAQKSATSWLYYCLKEHPALVLPAKKRDYHYLGGDAVARRGVDWYFQQLGDPTPAQQAGAVSVDYLFDRRASEAVRRHAPEAKLIAVLREPVERAVSAYYWHLRKGHLPARSLPEGLETLLEARREEAPGTDGVSRLGRDLVERGFYDVQLERYLRQFSGEQLLVLWYDAIRDRPQTVLEEIYGFLGVDPSFVPASLARRPKRNSYSRWLIRLERLAPRWRPIAKVADLLHRALPRTRGQSIETEAARAVRLRLAELYRPHVERLPGILAQLPAANRPGLCPWLALD